MHKNLRFAGLLLVSLGCARGNFSERSTAARPYTYPLPTNVATIDPARIQDVYIAEALQNVFEGLVGYNEKNEVAGRLAEKWRMEDKGRTFVFTLRNGVKFHNGRPVTAADFKWTFERNLSPEIASPTAASYLGAIVGVDDVVSGRSKTLKGVVASDDRTLRITLDKPRPYFLGSLTYPCAAVIAREGAGNGLINQPAQAIGTGPFTIASVVTDQELDLAANDAYYLGKPQIRTIRRPVIKEQSTSIAKYRSGEIDSVALGRSETASIRQDATLARDLQYSAIPGLNYLGMSQRAYPPFRDVRVRRAFTMAVDRPHIVKEVVTGYDEAFGILPPGIPGHRPDLRGIPYDPAKARELLKEAGYDASHPLPPLEIAYPVSQREFQLIAEAAAQRLEANLGVHISPRGLEMGTIISLQSGHKLPMTSFGWVADYLDPQNFLSLLHESTSGQNFDGYNNPEFDRLCRAADVEQDPVKRIALYERAEDIAVEDAARIPICFQRQAFLRNPRIQGLRSNQFGLMPHLTTHIAP